MFVVKSDGRKEKFDPAKIIHTCMRAGSDKRTAEKIAAFIGQNVANGASTHEIYNMIVDELERREDRTSLLFRLREAIAMLDSVSFEKYVTQILELNGYRCSWNRKVRGRYAEHQIDIVAKKEEDIFFVECKRHVNPHRYTGLNICLQAAARHEDILGGFSDGKNAFQDGTMWIIVNGKFSEHAKAYAHGKDVRLTGWKYGTPPLEELIHGKMAFPVTILTRDRAVAAEIIKNNILLVNDFLHSGLAKKKNLKPAAEQARLLLKAK